jgi:hypothetical protein
MKNGLLRNVAGVVVSVIATATLAHGGDSVCFEAEAMEGITAPMEIVDATQEPAEGAVKPMKGASGNKYVQIAAGKGKAPKVACQATFTFELEKEGTYYLWCRVCWDGECSNSFTMTLDDGLAFVFGEDATCNAWHWVKAPPRLKQLTLTKGKHTLTVKNREDGVRLDQVLLAMDKDRVPVNAETVTATSSLAAPKEAPAK